MLTGLRSSTIPWQTKTRIAGGTDAAAVQRTRGGVMTATVAVRCAICIRRRPWAAWTTLSI